MAKSWMNTLKEYFSLLNQLEVEGDISDLESFYQGKEQSRKEQERIERGRETLLFRRARPVKCKTVIRNMKILSEDKTKVDVLLHNYLWKLYYIDHHFMEQEVERCHNITLKEQNGRWFIHSDRVLGDEGFCVPEDRQTAFSPGYDASEEPAGTEPWAGRYNRAKAKRYAEIWWNQYNPSYPKFEVDCTNYVSQCLYAGGLPMELTGKRSSGWWVQGKKNWSYSWSVANSLMNYLLGGNTKAEPKAKLMPSADQLMVGDVICYDWDGNGHFQHNTVVVSKDPNGQPLVNAHTTNSRHRYWDYRDSYAWTSRTKYRFIHIVG